MDLGSEVCQLAPVYDCKYSLVNQVSFQPDDEEPKSKRMKIGKTKTRTSSAYVLNASVNASLNSHLLIHTSDDLVSVLDVDKSTVTRKVQVANLNSSWNALARFMIPKQAGGGPADGLNPHVMLLATQHTINLWDLRQKDLHTSGLSVPIQYGGNPLNVLAFDFDSTSHSVAAGTEVLNEDGFVCVCDVRSPNRLRYFKDCHADDVTEVRFHPRRPNFLATGSDDNLINVVDLSESKEDEALLHTLNGNMSISRIVWSWQDKQLFSILEDESVQLWDYEEAEPLKTLSAEDYNVTDATTFSAVVDLWNQEENTFLAVASKKGDVLISSINCDSEEINDCLTVYTGLARGHTALVRTVAQRNKTVYTGGEDGRVCFWRS